MLKDAISILRLWETPQDNLAILFFQKINYKEEKRRRETMIKRNLRYKSIVMNKPYLDLDSNTLFTICASIYV